MPTCPNDQDRSPFALPWAIGLHCKTPGFLLYVLVHRSFISRTICSCSVMLHVNFSRTFVYADNRKRELNISSYDRHPCGASADVLPQVPRHTQRIHRVGRQNYLCWGHIDSCWPQSCRKWNTMVNLILLYTVNTGAIIRYVISSLWWTTCWSGFGPHISAASIAGLFLVRIMSLYCGRADGISSPALPLDDSSSSTRIVSFSSGW